MDDQTAKQLRRKIQEGDEAFDQIIEAFWGVIFRVSDRIVRNEADAEEVTLETFYKARNAEYDSSIGSFQGWLCKIASNLALDLLRRRERDLRAVEQAGSWARHASLPARTDLLFWEAFRSCLKKLTETQRLVFLLSDVADLSLEEIALILDSTPGTVGVRRSEARGRMAECMGEKSMAMGERK